MILNEAEAHVRVPAKINLQLAVGAPRPDGYHGLVTVFAAEANCLPLVKWAKQTRLRQITAIRAPN